MNEKGLGACQVKRNLKKLEESLRKRFWRKKRVFWERNKEVSRERSKRNDFWIAQRPYIKS